MPTITLNKQVFEKLVGKKLGEEVLKERIAMLGTDLEGIDNNGIHVEIFPNRPDMLSEQGFARAFSSFIGFKKGIRTYPVKKSGHKVIIDPSVAKVRPYTCCALVEGITFDDEKIREVIQTQEKLHVTFGRNRKRSAIGIYPLEKITFPITFFAEKPNKVKFQPMDFPRHITGIEVLNEHPVGREYGYLLEGKELFPFFKDGKGHILSMPPIINSHEIGRITVATRNIFIECSGFDYHVQGKCLNMIVTALADMGGKILSLELDYGKKKLISPDLSPEKMRLDRGYVNKILGLNLTQKQIVELLSRMGYGSMKEDVLVPCYRADVLHQIDLVEDIAIAYGYENFSAVIPSVATIGSENKLEIFKRKLAELLIGLGLTELYTYNISSDTVMEKKFKGEKPIVLANSLSEEYNCLRNSLIPSLLEVHVRNRHHGYPQKIFDFGTIFLQDRAMETGIIEQEFLALTLCENLVNFTAVKQVLDYLFRILNCSYELKEALNDSFIAGRSAEIYLKGEKIGFLGEISPEVLTSFGLEYPIAAIELSLTKLFQLDSA